MNLQEMTPEQRRAVTSVLLRLSATLMEEAIKAPEENVAGLLSAAHTVSVEAAGAIRTMEPA